MAKGEEGNTVGANANYESCLIDFGVTSSEGLKTHYDKNDKSKDTFRESY